jgi:hypothetical protein
MLIEMMWPVELLGKEYVSAPIRYRNRPYSAVVEYQRGDLIRFVATEDGTNIYQMRQDGSGLKQLITNLKRGKYYDIYEQENAAYYKSNKKVIVGQYGKSWLSNVPPPVTDKVGDNPQNPSRNGQGMMLVLAPQERWCSYATFKCPTGMENSFYLTFTDVDFPKIKVDGAYIKTKYGAAVRSIPGTNFLYLVAEISGGDHFIQADDDARVAGYVYGHWDYSKDGFAYGYPVGINYATFCEDSLYMLDKQVCGDVTGTGFTVDLREDSLCAGLLNVIFKDEESENYLFDLDLNFKSGDLQANFTLTVIDKNKYAKGTVTVLTLSGKTVTRTWEYIPEDIIAVPSKVDFGLLKPGDKVTKQFTLKNPTKTTVTVNKLKLKRNLQEFIIESKDFPCTIAAGMSRTVDVSATAIKDAADSYYDYVIAELSCYEKEIDTLSFKTGEPIVWIGDANWGTIPVNVERVKTVEIINQGAVPVILDKMDWPDKVHFTRVENLNFPLTLLKGETHEFQVYYKADVPGVAHKTTALFEGNTTKVKLYSDWEGQGMTVGPVITPYDWKRKRMDDKFWTKYAVDNGFKYDATLGYIGSVDLSAIGNTKLINVNVKIENDVDGVFSFNQSEVPQVIVGDAAALPLTVYFKPKAEKDYSAHITLTGEFNGKALSISADLVGTGILPHVNVIGKTWADMLIGKVQSENGQVKHNMVLNNVYAMPLTVNGLSIEGTHKANFVIDPTWLTANPYPIKIDIASSIDVPIIFTANDVGVNTATLVSDDDATDPVDNHKGDLLVKVYKPDLIPTDYDYLTIFKTTTKDGQVTLSNIGSIPITITRDITASLEGTDPNSFIINTWYVKNGSFKKSVEPKVPFVLDLGDVLYIDVTFKPMDSKKYSAKIVYKNDFEERTSTLVGIGEEMWTLVSIPDYPNSGGSILPGEPVTISVNYATHPSKEAKYKDNLEAANITEFKTLIYFKDASRVNVQDVYPAEVNNEVVTIINDNTTMTNGWTVVNSTIVDKEHLLIEMSGPSALKSSNLPLLKVKFNTFLSDLNLIPIPVEFKLQNKTYVNIDNDPGSIKIDPVCVNTLRLVKLSGSEFTLSQVNPNPVSGNTSIKYSVGFECKTTIELFTSNGDKVATLVNQTLKPGAYELSFDVNQLGLNSGAFFYRMKSGPFEETKSLILAK